MNLYLIEYGILMLNVFLSHGFSRSGKRKIYIISALQLILITILRSPLDTSWPDTENYISTLTYLNKTITWPEIFHAGWEPGIVAIAKIIGYITNDSQGYIIVFGLLILIPIFIMIWKYCESPILGLFIFYAMGDLTMTSIYRQWLAMSILAFSLKYVYERKWRKFYIFVFIAMLFHRTAIIFGIVYFLYDFKLSQLKILYAMSISGMLYLLGPQILFILNRFARIEQTVEQRGGETLLLVLWICILISYYIGRNNLHDPRLRIPMNIVLIGAITQPISFTFSLWSRIVYYFSLYLVLLIPRVFAEVKVSNMNSRKYIILMEVLFMAVMLGWFCAGGVNEYIHI